MAESTTDQPLSKSQKKRMKRNKSKAKAAAASNAAGDDASVASSVQSGPGQPNPNENVNSGVTTAAQMASQLNPIDKMRSDIMKQGFKFEEVEGAMNEMWEKELAYDEYDAVLSFLEAKSSASANASSAVVEAPIEIKANGGTSSETAAITASEETVSTESKHKGSSAPEKAVISKKSDKHDKKAKDVSSTGATADSSKASLPVPAVAIDFALKLELVAKHENIHDAAYAITEWASKIASQEEATSICTKHNIILTLLQRSIVECTESEFVKVLPYLLNLICIVFPPTNISKSGYRDGLTKVLNAARKASAASTDALDSGAGSKIGTVVSKALSGAMSSQVVAGGGSAPKGSSKISPVGAKHEQDVARLLQKRDAAKDAAAKSYVMTEPQSNAQESAPKEVTEVSNGFRRTIFEEHDPELSNLFSASKNTHDKIMAGLDSSNSQFSSSREAAENALKVCQKEKASVESRKEEIMAELKALDEQESALDAQESQLASSLEKLLESFGASKADIQQKIMQPKKVLKVARACNNVDDILATFQKNLSTPVSLNGHSKKITSREANPDDYFIKMAAYFEAEADLHELLTSRVNALCARADKIEREVIECRNLGLATNVSQLEGSMVEVGASVEEDKRAISVLKQDSETMRAQLVSQVRDMLSNDLPAHTKSLKQIKNALISIGVDTTEVASLISEDEEVDLSEHPVEMSDMTEDPVYTNDPNSSKEDNAYTPTPVAPPVSKSTVMPKLSWAAASAAPSKPSGKSLREIQDEEREAGRG